MDDSQPSSSNNTNDLFNDEIQRDSNDLIEKIQANDEEKKMELNENHHIEEKFEEIKLIEQMKPLITKEDDLILKIDLNEEEIQKEFEKIKKKESERIEPNKNKKGKMKG